MKTIATIIIMLISSVLYSQDYYKAVMSKTYDGSTKQWTNEKKVNIPISITNEHIIVHGVDVYTIIRTLEMTEKNVVLVCYDKNLNKCQVFLVADEEYNLGLSIFYNYYAIGYILELN